MLEKINVELKKLEQEKAALTNQIEFDKLVAEKVAEFKANLIVELNAEKDEKIKEIDFKVQCLENWKQELEQDNSQDVPENTSTADPRII